MTRSGQVSTTKRAVLGGFKQRVAATVLAVVETLGRR